jgi:hypothetical protein
MSPLTLFKAYERAMERKATAKHHRRRERGIAVESDHWAKVWQRADRQARKLGQRIREVLDGEFHPTCYLCGFYKYACTCKLGYHPRSQ